MEEKYWIGIDLGGTNARLGLIQNGKILRLLSQKYNARGTEEEVLQTLYRMIDEVHTLPFEAIGVGVPTVVDVEKGIVYDTLNIPSWKEVPLKSLLEKRYQVPAFINNDANCFVLGERMFGKAREYHHVVGMVLGTGVGAGLIINDQLYSGRHCGAGEFGCIPFRDRTLEDYCSGTFFSTVHGVSGEEMAFRARQGDPKALHAFAEYGNHLGAAIMTVMYAVDPELIILGGSVSRSFQFFKNTMWQALQKFPYQRAVQDLKIEVSELEEVGVLGAAALCMTYFCSI
jgi:glucokinase